MGVLFIFLSASSFLLYQGMSAVDTEEVFVKEGDPVTLHTGVEKKQDRMKWYFNDIRIAQINGDPSKTCTDVQCNEGTERFRDRLKLDNQTGSLTITNTRTTDEGLYKLWITSGDSDSEKIFSVSVHDVESVMEGDSVTLHTGVEKNQQDRMKWYFNDTRIAQINGDPSKTCTDVQCNEGTESFRDRLKLDHQTGSLTITNIKTTDSGEYKLMISSSDSDREKIFSVTVRGVKRKSVKEGESVTLDIGVTKNPNDVMTWHFKDTLIAEITGDQSKICTDVQCDERFRDRLKLDHQTGSLTIMNTRNTDAGEYQLLINSRSSLRRRRRRSISSVKSFDVTVIAVPDSGRSSGFAVGISAVVVLLVSVAAAAAAVIYRRCRIFRNVMRGKEQGVSEESPSTSSLMTGEKTEVIESEKITTASTTLFPNEIKGKRAET